jgi:tryptophanyl-tRNA synthetase
MSKSMKKTDIIVSGIRPTGNLHLGNYFGAVSQFKKFQEEYPCYFFIADIHSLTTHPSTKDLKKNVRNVLVQYLASGLDPQKSTLYIQSDIRTIPELYLLLNMTTYLGELEKVPSFKDKVRSQPENVNAGLLTYPVLMAADIIIHKATKVPVGKDQEQHLELVKHIVRRFNKLCGQDIFPVPEAFHFGSEFVKIPGLDGSGKMGKSEGEGNAIFLNDPPDIARKKVMRAVTDAGPTFPQQPMTEPIKNLFLIMKHISTNETYAHFEKLYNNCTIRYGDLKKQLAEDVTMFLAPIQEGIKEYESNQQKLDEILDMGAEKARESAERTMKEVRQAIGFRNSK